MLFWLKNVLRYLYVYVCMYMNIYIDIYVLSSNGVVWMWYGMVYFGFFERENFLVGLKKVKELIICFRVGWVLIIFSY